MNPHAKLGWPGWARLPIGVAIVALGACSSSPGSPREIGTASDANTTQNDGVIGQSDGGKTDGGKTDGAKPKSDGTTIKPDGVTTVAPTFVTFLGGSAFEQARDVTVDSSGNIIVVGGTASPNFPVTAGAYDTSFASGGSSLGSGGPMDVFVAKYTSAGKLLWATYVGGPNYDRAYAVETDASGNIYVAGRAGDQFPTTPGVLQSTFAGDSSPNGLYGKQDGFVLKLSADGKTLLWSTYFGGGGPEFLRDFDIDASGNIYVGVADVSGAFPHVTAGAYRTTPYGGVDDVVAKISPDGKQVLWATYFGGGGDESVPSVRVAAGGELVLATSTTSGNLPVSANAYQKTKKGGSDFFAVKFAADGKSLRFCTYFGGSANEAAETHHLAVDSQGNVLIAAETQSADLPTSPGALQTTLKGQGDAFIAKLSADGSKLLAATYLGGSGWDAIQGIAVDGAGNIYMGGTTPSANLPVTSGAYRSTYGGNGDAWAAWLAVDLTSIKYLTYLGAGQDDQQRSLWIDGAGNIVSVGQTASPAFPVTPGAAQPTYGGGLADSYVARFKIH